MPGAGDIDKMLDWGSAIPCKKRLITLIAVFAIGITLTVQSIEQGFQVVAPQVLAEVFASDPDSFLCKSLKYSLAIPVILGIGWVGDHAGRLPVIIVLLSASIIFSILTLALEKSEYLFMAGYAVVEAAFAPSLLAFASIFLYESLASRYRTPSILGLYLMKVFFGLIAGLIVSHAHSGDWSHTVLAVCLTAVFPLGLAFFISHDTAFSLFNRGLKEQAYKLLLLLAGATSRPPITASEFSSAKKVEMNKSRFKSHAIIHFLTQATVVLQDGFLSTFMHGLSAVSSPMAAIALSFLAGALGIISVHHAYIKHVNLRMFPVVAIAVSALTAILLLPTGAINDFFEPISHLGSLKTDIRFGPLIALGCFVGNLVSEVTMAVIMIITLNFHPSKTRCFGVAQMLAGEAAWRFKVTAILETQRTQQWYYELQAGALLLVFVTVLYLMWRNDQLADCFGQGPLLEEPAEQPADAEKRIPIVFSHKVIGEPSGGPLVIHRQVTRPLEVPLVTPLAQLNLVPSAPASPRKSSEAKVPYFGFLFKKRSASAAEVVNTANPDKDHVLLVV